jgi:serine phosphatase RsbU (regulator of sigma subunit)
MKLTKKELEEVSKVYNIWLSSYLNGDIKTYDSFFDDKYHFIGSTANEQFLDRKSTTQFLKDTADQLAGKVQIINNRRIIEKFEGLVFVTELFDTNFLIAGEWTYYGKFRFTSALKKNKEGWRFVYQHFSTPDSKAEEGETIGTEKIAAENLMLREAVKRRTFELEDKNRELEIEAALEKVRSRSLAMRKSKELEIVITILLQQLGEVGILLDTASIVIPSKDKKTSVDWTASKNYKYSKGFIVPFMENGKPALSGEINRDMVAALKSGKEFTKSYSRKEKNKYFQNLFDKSGFSETPEARKEFLLSLPAISVSTAGSKNSYIQIFSYSGEELSAADLAVLKRFAMVFEQCYIRFQDLEKAEAQAREAEIELALERVRARTMAMQKSDELLDAASLLFQQVKMLGCDPFSCGFVLLDKNKPDGEFFMSAEGKFQPSVFIPNNDESAERNMYLQWKKGKKLYMEDGEGKDLVDHFAFLMSLPGKTGEMFRAMKKAGIKFPKWQRWHAAYFSQGYLLFITKEAFEETSLFPRFASVFEQTYTRFLDLQKAEAQAREAQIEASLERVRSRSMAMHKSEEIAAVASVLFHQLQQLDLPNLRRCLIGIVNEKKGRLQSWHTSLRGDSTHKVIDYPIDGHPVIRKKIKGWRRGKPFSIELSPKELKDFIKYIVKHGFEYQKGEKPATKLIQNHVPFKYGYLEVATHEAIADQEFELVQRFARVFEQTYTRFLDLQKAEVQAREAQIEASLERVRSKTMAMHNSHDVGDTVITLFDEVLKLGLDKSIRVGIGILEGTELMETWSATSFPNGKVDLKMGKLDMTIHPMLIGLKKAWESGKKGYSYDYKGDDVVRYYTALNNEPDYPFYIDLDTLPENEYHKSFFYTEGILFSFATNPISDEAANVLNRFAGVFGQTYRRYLDLQKAEAQAREAQIETSLERVRSRTMAMHKSEELSETAAHLFAQLNELDIQPYRCNIAIVDAELDRCQLWSTTNEGDVISIGPFIPLIENHIFKNMYNGWKNLQDSLIIKIVGEERLSWINYINKYVSFAEYKPGNIDKEKILQEVAVFSCVFFKQGFFVVHTTEEISKSDFKIIQRFANVFEQTYTRFLDLKKAEEQAREAIKQASLDRVRGQIASMRSTEDLKHITPLIWSELTNLDVPFIRCGIFIVDEKLDMVQVYLTTPDGKPLGVLNLHSDANELTSNTVEFWRNKKVYNEHWNKQEFINWSKSMIELGQIQSQEEYQGDVEPPESLDLHFIPFEQGMLYVGNKEPLSQDKIDLVKSLAEAFSIAYARYEDFDRLETAKKEVETAFGELDLLSKELKIKNEELEKENQRKAIELEEARAFQLSMLPTSLPTVENLDLAVYTITATEVGGDYYDFSFKDDGSLNIALGDATGHGMRSGSMVSIMKSFFIAQSNNSSIEDFFISSNNSLKQMSLNRMMMAFGMINISDNRIKFCSAGIPPFIIYHKNNVEELPLYGLPLGAMKNTDYQFLERKLNSGDIIFAMSDGLPELKNEKDIMFGYNRVNEELTKVASKSSGEIIEHFKGLASYWANGKEIEDDITFVVVKVI